MLLINKQSYNFTDDSEANFEIKCLFIKFLLKIFQNYFEIPKFVLHLNLKTGVIKVLYK